MGLPPLHSSAAIIGLGLIPQRAPSRRRAILSCPCLPRTDTTTAFQMVDPAVQREAYLLCRLSGGRYEVLSDDDKKRFIAMAEIEVRRQRIEAILRQPIAHTSQQMPFPDHWRQ